MNPNWTICLAICAVIIFPCCLEGQDTKKWEGQWITDYGVMELKVDGKRIEGSYGEGGTMTGTATDDKITLKYQKGNSRGTLTVSSADGLSFEGQWEDRQKNSGTWRGWKKDPDAEDAELADFSGYWMTSWGPMRIEQTGEKVEGTFAANGWGTIEGKVAGRRMTLDRHYIRWDNQAWLEMTPDGSRLYGLNLFDKPAPWTGIRVPDFQYHVDPQAGEIVNGIADNGMLYHLRMPDDWKEGEDVDVVVLLHGSNWTTAGMVYVTSENWPDIGKKFAILGIQGEMWNEYSNADSPRFNYTYQNWMGRSTYGGYPFTDRESPYLVTNVIKELGELHGFGRVFAGGHSQGGFLTHILHMHFAEELAGTFPIAGGVPIQAIATAFDDEELMKAQRETPMAIVHGKNDRVVGWTRSRDVYNQNIEDGFNRLILVSPNGGHPYDFLPIDQAINYLDMMTTDDVEAMASYAKQMVRQKQWRVVGNLIERAKEIKAGKSFSPIWKAYEDAAKKDAKQLLRAMRADRNSKWANDFLDWSEEFALSNAGEEIRMEYGALREEQEEQADQLMKEAVEARWNGNRSVEMAKYREIMEMCYASKYFRLAEARSKKQ